MQSTLVEKAWPQELEVAGRAASVVRRWRGMDTCVPLSSLCSVRSLWKLLHRQDQMSVSMATLNPVRLTNEDEPSGKGSHASPSGDVRLQTHSLPTDGWVCWRNKERVYARLRQESRKCVKQGCSPSLKLTNLVPARKPASSRAPASSVPWAGKSPGLQTHTGFSGGSWRTGLCPCGQLQMLY